jgi:hypothetical protein
MVVELSMLTRLCPALLSQGSNFSFPTMTLLPAMAMTDPENAQFYIFVASVLLVLVAYYHGVLLRLVTRKSGPPDYFKLTGAPPPTPLLDFDIDKAKPRPYRPFRWAYHQTMCAYFALVIIK